jgi:hypothetical protein
MAMFAASRARNDALINKQRFEAGEFSIDLVRVADDPPEDGPAFQAELGEFLKSFRAAGVTVSQEGMAFDAVDGGGYPLAVFVVSSLGLPLIGAATHVCATWVKARAGRKLRLKIGDVVAEGQTVEDIERLMKQAAEFCAANPKKEEPGRARELFGETKSEDSQ